MHSSQHSVLAFQHCIFMPVHVHGLLARSDRARRSRPLCRSEAWGRDNMVSKHWVAAWACMSRQDAITGVTFHSAQQKSECGRLWKIWKIWKLGNFCLSVNSRKIGRSPLSVIADGLTKFLSAVAEGFMKSPSAVAEGLIKFTIRRFGRQSDLAADRKDLRSPTR